MDSAPPSSRPTRESDVSSTQPAETVRPALIDPQFLSVAVTFSIDGAPVLTQPIRRPDTAASWLAAYLLLDGSERIPEAARPEADELLSYYMTEFTRVAQGIKDDSLLLGVVADALFYERLLAGTNTILDLPTLDGLARLAQAELIDDAAVDYFGAARLRQALLLGHTAPTLGDEMGGDVFDDSQTCAMLGAISPETPEALGLLGYELRSEQLGCISTRDAKLHELLGALPSASDPYPILRSLLQSDLLEGDISAPWLNEAEREAGDVLVAHPSGEALVRFAVLRSANAAPAPLTREQEATALRYVLSGGWNPESVVGMTDIDAALLTGLDESRGMLPPSALTTAAVLEALEGDGLSEKISRAVQRSTGVDVDLSATCGQNPENLVVPPIVSPTTLMAVSAKYAATVPCGAATTTATQVADLVEERLLTIDGIESAWRVWASAYTACRYDTANAVQGWLAGRVEPTEEFSLPISELSYVSYFSAYVNEWNSAMLWGEVDCTGSTAWSRS